MARGNKQKERKYQASRETNGEQLIGIQYGSRTLKVISANFGDLRNLTTQHEIGIRTGQMKADIVCIRETHNAITEDEWIGNYRYISNGAQKVTNKPNEKWIGGVAIMIKKEWYQNIERITRHSHRTIQISLKTGQKNK